MKLHTLVLKLKCPQICATHTDRQTLVKPYSGILKHMKPLKANDNKKKHTHTQKSLQISIQENYLRVSSGLTKPVRSGSSPYQNTHNSFLQLSWFPSCKLCRC